MEPLVQPIPPRDMRSWECEMCTADVAAALVHFAPRHVAAISYRAPLCPRSWRATIESA